MSDRTKSEFLGKLDRNIFERFSFIANITMTAQQEGWKSVGYRAAK